MKRNAGYSSVTVSEKTNTRTGTLTGWCCLVLVAGGSVMWIANPTFIFYIMIFVRRSPRRDSKMPLGHLR